ERQEEKAMEGSVITRASHEWFRRPDDERYPSLEELHQATLERARRSKARVIEYTSLAAHAEGSSLSAHHPDLGVFDLTDWSLSQLAKRVHAPARFIREIGSMPGGASLAAEALNFGLRHLAERENLQLLSLHPQDTGGRAEIRALLGPDYGRIFDHEVVSTV